MVFEYFHDSRALSVHGSWLVDFCCSFQASLFLETVLLSVDHGVPARSRAGCEHFSVMYPVTPKALRTSQKPVSGHCPCCRQTGISQPLRISQVPIGRRGPLASSCPEVFIVGEMIPTLLRVLCTKRSDSSSPRSGSAPKGLHFRRVAAGHRARPESPRGRTCKAPGRAQAPSGSATRLPGADRGAPAPASNSRVRSRSLPESSEPSIDRGSGSVSSAPFARRRSSVYGRP